MTIRDDDTLVKQSASKPDIDYCPTCAALSKNFEDLDLFNKPAQQEPVGEVFINTGNGVLFAPMKDVRWVGGKMPPEGTKLYTSPQPAQQQETVATDWERVARVQDAKLRAMCDEPGGFEKLCEVMDRYERTSSPDTKPWVGLKLSDKNAIFRKAELRMEKDQNLSWRTALVEETEAKLREKNR